VKRPRGAGGERWDDRSGLDRAVERAVRVPLGQALGKRPGMGDGNQLRGNPWRRLTCLPD
jgi:hypothetical protein